MGLARYTPADARSASSRWSLVAVVFCLPFYLLVAIALETTAQTYSDAALVPAGRRTSGNFSEAWRHRRARRARPLRSRAA